MPIFSARVDERGHVAYRGTGYVARPGYYEVDVPADSVRQLLLDIIDAGYLQLKRQYETAADGCSEVSTDASTSTFTLSAGEHTKEVRMYWGCEVDVSATLQRLDKEIEHATTVGRFIYPNPGFETCDHGTTRDLPKNWVITDSPSLTRLDFGLLRIQAAGAWEQHWSLTNCQGEPIADGDAIRTECTELLLPSKNVDAYFPWPGLDEPQGAAILEPSGLEQTLTRVGTALEHFRETSN